MSIEYFAQTGFFISENHIAGIRELLKNDPAVELWDKRRDNRITLRFTDIPKREAWPEDAVIIFENHSVCLSFHSSPSDGRESFVKKLEGLLESEGIPCEFVEE